MDPQGPPPSITSLEFMAGPTLSFTTTAEEVGRLAHDIQGKNGIQHKTTFVTTINVCSHDNWDIFYTVRYELGMYRVSVYERLGTSLNGIGFETARILLFQSMPAL
jgi:hypothetical protein